MISPVALWPEVAGMLVLIAGLIIVWPAMHAARGWNKLIYAAGPMYAAPMAVFGTQHLIVAAFVQRMVPAWIPFPLFWAYLVGVALIAAAVSIAARQFVLVTGLLLAAMFFVFVLVIHLPNAVRHHPDRIFWTLAFRDLGFAAGGLAWSASARSLSCKPWIMREAAALLARLIIAAAVTQFGVEVLLHPEFAPGVPLEMRTPAWVPLPLVWGYLTGAVLLAAGIGLLLRRTAKAAGIAAGAVLLLLTLALYLPIALMESGTSAIVEGVNYVSDTLFFAGAALLLAATCSLDAGNGNAISDSSQLNARSRWPQNVAQGDP